MGGREVTETQNMRRTKRPSGLLEDREGKAPRNTDGCKELRISWIIANKDPQSEKAARILQTT